MTTEAVTMIRGLIRRAAQLFSPVTAQTDELRMFPTDWLVGQISVQQAEEHEEVGGDSWNALKTAIKPGDQIWIYCTPPKTWEILMGSRGIVLLRDGEKIARVETLRN